MTKQVNLMRFKGRTREKGQALVLIAMLIVILLAALGLAIDGGGMFLLWRDAQNAVDAAALQAAFAYCTNGQNLTSAQTAGYTAAEMNGFVNDSETVVTVDRAANLVPTSQLPSNAVVVNDIIMVKIDAQKPSYFIQLVYGGPLEVHVNALGVCNAGGDNFFDGYAVYSMGSEAVCGDSYVESDFTGSSANFYSNIGSNADLRINGNNVGGMVFHDGAGLKYVTGIDTDKVTTDPNTGAVPGSGATEAVAEQPYSSFPVLYTWSQFEKDSGEIWNNIDALDGTLGNWQSDPNLQYYSSSTVLEDANMQGLYVVDGDVTVKGNFSVGSSGITIVLTGQFDVQGNINNKTGVTWHPFTSTAEEPNTNSLFVFSSEAPNGNPPTSCVSGSGQAAISFSGSGIVAEGIIYAPYSTVYWSASDAYYCGSIISLAYNSSGSSKFFFSDEIPDDATLQADGASQWFLDRNFEGKNCDYINSSSSNIFLGDVSGN